MKLLDLIIKQQNFFGQAPKTPKLRLVNETKADFTADVNEYFVAMIATQSLGFLELAFDMRVEYA